MARTLRNKYDKYLTYDKLMQAHLLCRKNKTLKKDIIKFELKQEDYIRYIYEKLKNQTYSHGGYTTFYIHEPKLRKIEKSSYMDRVVHRWLVDNFLIDLYIPTFINTTYACIKERGMIKGVLDLQKAMKSCKSKWGNYYILKMDVAKYFKSIDKDILFNIIKRKIKDEKVLWLIKNIIYSSDGQKGIAIGNYTSQIFANIYLNEVDQYVKHTLRVKYYFRYMDDSVILVKTKNEAKEILDKIKKFLKDNLDLELNSKTQIFKSKQGVNFCGYKTNEYRLKIRDRGKKKLKKKVKLLKKQIKEKKLNCYKAKQYLCGHFGYIKHADVYNLTKKVFYNSEQY